MILKMIQFRDTVFQGTFDRIIYIYPKEDQSVMRNAYVEQLNLVCPFVEVMGNLPDQNVIRSEAKILLILDDFSREINHSKKMWRLMTMNSHHYNNSIIYTLQNAFEKGPHGVTFTRQVTGYIVFRNRSDKVTDQTLSKKIFTNAQMMGSCFDFLKRKFPQGSVHYLYASLHPHDGADKTGYLACTKIFPDPDGKVRPIMFYDTNNPPFSMKNTGTSKDV